MRDIAAIAADLRRFLPLDHWGLVDEMVNYLIGQIATTNEIMKGFQKDLREKESERYAKTLSTER